MATSAINAATGAMNGILGGIMTRGLADPLPEQIACAAQKKDVCEYHSKF